MERNDPVHSETDPLETPGSHRGLLQPDRCTVDVDVREFIMSVVEKDRSGNIVQQWQGSAGMRAHTLPTVATQILLKRATLG